MDYRPMSLGHDALVPGLVLRYFQVYLNLWVHQQLATDQFVAFPTGVHDIWTLLALQSPIWEKPFLMRYITSAAPLPGSATPMVVANVGNYVAPSPVLSNSGSVTPWPRTQETHRNLYPNHNEAEYKVFREAMVGKSSNKSSRPVYNRETPSQRIIEEKRCASHFMYWAIVPVFAAAAPTITVQVVATTRKQTTMFYCVGARHASPWNDGVALRKWLVTVSSSSRRIPP
jgi:hypothetical protein